MERSEEIFIESNKYATEMHDAYPSIDIDTCAFDFKAGAEWADEHPQSPWIRVEDDLPYKHKGLNPNSRKSTKLVLVRTKKAAYFVNYMINKESKWEWFCAVDDIEDEIEYWMPLPKLPKE